MGLHLIVAGVSAPDIATREIKEFKENKEAVNGQLTKSKMGYSMPVDAPAYLEPPFYFENSHWYQFTYVTDPKMAAAIVPAQFTLSSAPVASLIFGDYRQSSFGPYYEVIQGIHVNYKGADLLYMTRLYLSEELPTLAGREIWGFPKRVADIKIEQKQDLISMSLQRPEGVPLINAVIRDEKPLVPLVDGSVSKIATLRVIPSPEKGKKHSLVELIQTDAVFSSVKMWEGKGSLNYGQDQSGLDPIGALPIVEYQGCIHLQFNAKLPHGKILETL